MKKWLVAVALSCIPGLALAGGPPDMSGGWKINGAFDALGVTYSLSCVLAEDTSGKFAGSCKDSEGQDVTCAGAVSGSKVEFAYDTTYQGVPVHLDYKGDAQPDGTIKGAVDAGGPQGVFTASRH